MKKAKKYLIEFTLVIVGILIAFSIENWAQQRNDRAALQSYLRQIQLDLNNDATALQEIVVLDSLNILKLKILYQRVNEGKFGGIDSLASLLVSYRAYSTSTIGYSMLVNSPQSSLLSTELYAHITEFYGEFANFHKEQLQLERDFTNGYLSPLYLQYYKHLEQAATRPDFNAIAFAGYTQGRIVLLGQVLEARKLLLAESRKLQLVLEKKITL